MARKVDLMAHKVDLMAHKVDLMVRKVGCNRLSINVIYKRVSITSE
jgi:hypothetical protein